MGVLGEQERKNRCLGAYLTFRRRRKRKTTFLGYRDAASLTVKIGCWAEKSVIMETECILVKGARAQQGVLINRASFIRRKRVVVGGMLIKSGGDDGSVGPELWSKGRVLNAVIKRV